VLVDVLHLDLPRSFVTVFVDHDHAIVVSRLAPPPPAA
jgi:hypothetical protein